ncbi:hypothetical protein OIO90_004290 [Microbotryomycetes sp. JL221]|nr:hypothetical protein OIO90_004290 [Microbotryomycetes sp. JL221]
MPYETPIETLHHIGNGIPCRFFNKYQGQCRDAHACVYSHVPDDNSLRLVKHRLAGNVCQQELIKVGGCDHSKKRKMKTPTSFKKQLITKNKCWYSHDLENDTGFKDFNLMNQPQLFKKVLELMIKLTKQDRSNLTMQDLVSIAVQSIQEQSDQIDDDMSFQHDQNQTIDIRNKCGHDILRALGGSRPMLVDRNDLKPVGPSVLSLEEQSMFYSQDHRHHTENRSKYDNTPKRWLTHGRPEQRTIRGKRTRGTGGKQSLPARPTPYDRPQQQSQQQLEQHEQPDDELEITIGDTRGSEQAN